MFVLLITPLSASAVTSPPTTTTVTFAPSHATGACDNFVPSADYDLFSTLHLDSITTHTISQTSDAFTVQFTLLKNLCNPFTAKAAVYDLPAKPYLLPWPQTLYSVFGFTVQDSGTYTVTFSKTCVGQQFDLITGPTPKTLDSINSQIYHGPLLYPFESALIWEGTDCNETTTSTTTSTSTSTSTTTTSTSTSTSTTTTVPTTESTTTTSTTTTVPTTESTTTTSTTTTVPTTESTTTTTSTPTTESTTTAPTTSTTTSTPVSVTVLGTVVTRPSCNTTSTTTTSTTTTTAPTTTTTRLVEIDAIVTQPSTTTTAPTTTTTVPCDPGVPSVQVLGNSVSTLPVTGTNVKLVIGFGLTLLAGGALFVSATRKRKPLIVK